MYIRSLEPGGACERGFRKNQDDTQEERSSVFAHHLSNCVSMVTISWREFGLWQRKVVRLSLITTASRMSEAPQGKDELSSCSVDTRNRNRRFNRRSLSQRSNAPAAVKCLRGGQMPPQRSNFPNSGQMLTERGGNVFALHEVR